MSTTTLTYSCAMAGRVAKGPTARYTDKNMKYEFGLIRRLSGAGVSSRRPANSGLGTARPGS